MKRILVVDDSWLIRDRVAKTLKDNDFEVEIATGGQECIDKVKSSPPELIILDLLMPSIDGYSVLETMQKESIAIPIIVLSADIQETTQNRCRQLGATDFIEKPPNSEALIYKVRKALGYETNP